MILSSDTFDLVNAARRCAQAAWSRDEAGNFGFTKAGVLLGDLVRFEDRPRTLFDVARPKPAALMTALDQVNDRFGKKTMVLASEGMGRSWQLYFSQTRIAAHEQRHDIPPLRDHHQLLAISLC